MNQRQHKILSLLRYDDKTISVGRIETKLGIKRSDVIYDLDVLEIQGHVTLERSPDSGTIKRALITPQGKDSFISKALGNSKNINKELEELKRAIEEVQAMVVEIEKQPHEKQRDVLSKVNTALDVIQKAPQVAHSIYTLLQHFTQ